MITVQKKSKVKQAVAVLLPVTVFAGILVFTTIFMNDTSRFSEEETFRTVERNVMKAITSCYAFEGEYPPTVEYLQKNYGLSLSDSYIVHYEVFAPDIMPSVSVIRAGSDENGGKADEMPEELADLFS